MSDSSSEMTGAGSVPAFWRGKNVLVTGCTGLLGSWLSAALAQRGANVVGLVRDLVPRSNLYLSGVHKKINIVNGTVNDAAAIERMLAEYEVEVCFHLAAQTIVGIANRSPISTFESNIKGTWVVLEAARNCRTLQQIIVASSDKAYGAQAGLPYREDTPLQGNNPYDVSKSCADLLAQTYAQTFGLPVAITRCGNLYGGGDLNWNRLVPGTIRSAFFGQRPVIRSNGRYIRDYLHVKDATAAYMLLAERLAACPELRGQAFNFSHELQLTVLELVQRILLLMDADVQPDIRNEASGEIVHQYLSAAKAHHVLGWAPLLTLDEGLNDTIAWYRRFLADG